MKQAPRTRSGFSELSLLKDFLNKAGFEIKGSNGGTQVAINQMRQN